MKKLGALSLCAGIWVAACSQDSDVPNAMGGSGGSMAGSGGSSVGGAPTVGGTSSTSGATSKAGGGAGGMLTAGTGGADAGGTAGSGGLAGGGAGGTAGSAGTAGAGGMMGYPEPTTCSGYAAKFGTFGAYANADRVVEDSFTLEAWIKTSTASLTGENFWNGNGLIYADIGGENDDFGASILGNKLAFGTGNPDTTLVGATSINTGDWVHIAATRDASTGVIEVLLFGNSDGQVTTTNTGSLDANTKITFGANAVDGRYFNGLMDEVRIWDHVRTPAQIKAALHHKLRGDEPGLVGYWTFEEAGEAAQLDASPSNADAAIVGAVSWVDGQAPVCDPIPDPGGEGGAGGQGAGGEGGASGGVGGEGGGD